MRSIFCHSDILFSIFCHFDILLSIFCHFDILFSIFCHFDILSVDILRFRYFAFDIPQYDILLIRYFAYSIFLRFDILSFDILRSIFCDSIFCFSMFCPEPRLTPGLCAGGRFGRRPSILATLCVLLPLAMFVALSGSVMVFIVIRFLVAMAVVASYTSLFVFSKSLPTQCGR